MSENNKTSKSKRVVYRPYSIPSDGDTKANVATPAPIPQEKKVSAIRAKTATIVKPRETKEREKHVPAPANLQNASKNKELKNTFTEEDYYKLDDNIKAEDIRDVKKIVASFPFNDMSAIINFGIETQERVRAITDRMLVLSKGCDNKIDTYLRMIQSGVASVDPNDLIGSGGGFRGVVRSLMSGITPHEQISLVIKNVEVASNRIERELPEIQDHIVKITRLEDDVYKSQNDVYLYILACKVIIKLVSDMKKELQNSGEDSYDLYQEMRHYDYILTTIEARLNNFRMLKLNEQLDNIQIPIMKKNYIDKVDMARNTILGLVISWKAQCSSALTMADAGMHHSFTSTLGNISFIRDKLCTTIDKTLS